MSLTTIGGRARSDPTLGATAVSLMGMRAFSVIDNQPEAETVAVWVTSRGFGTEPTHANAVVIDKAADPDAAEKVRSLTRMNLVLLTEGSTAEGLPVEGDVLTTADIDLLVRETETLQEAIRTGVARYQKETGRSVAFVEFPRSPGRQDFPLQGPQARDRAFQTANYLLKAWKAWLVTEAERQHRSINPRSKTTPWMLPEDLSSPTMALLPTALTDRAQPQPQV